MTQRKWCDKIIKANEDTWLRFFNHRPFLRAFSTNQQNASYVSFLSLSRVVSMAQRLFDCLILHWCCSRMKRLLSHMWSNIWMSVQHCCPWRQRWTRGPLSNTHVVSGPVCFSPSSALLSCRFPCGYMLRRIFQFYRDYMHICVAKWHNGPPSRALILLLCTLLSTQIFIFLFILEDWNLLSLSLSGACCELRVFSFENSFSWTHGIIVGARSPYTVVEEGLAVGKVIGHGSVKSAAWMNEAVVFVEKVEQVNRPVANISVGGRLLPLSKSPTKVTLSNVPLFITDEFLCRQLSRNGRSFLCWGKSCLDVSPSSSTWSPIAGNCTWSSTTVMRTWMSVSESDSKILTMLCLLHRPTWNVSVVARLTIWLKCACSGAESPGAGGSPTEQ